MPTALTRLTRCLFAVAVGLALARGTNAADPVVVRNVWPVSFYMTSIGPNPSWLRHTETNHTVGLGERMVFTGYKLVGWGGLVWPERDLWSTDGTGAGTVLLNQGPIAGSLTRFGSGVLFHDYRGLWRTDGTPEGTTLLKELWVAPQTPRCLSDERPAQTSCGDFVVAGDRAFFFVEKGASTELWRTDGSAKGTVRLSSGFTFDTQAYSFAALDHRLIFMARRVATGRMGLYVSNGKVGGTKLVKRGLSSLFPPAVAGGKAYFWSVVRSQDAEAFELWTSDGTSRGTRRLTDFLGAWWERYPHFGLASLGNQVFFHLETWLGEELWTTDGSSTGPQLVLAGQTFPMSLSSSPGLGMAQFRGGLFFVTTTGGEARLWRTDGTAHGTRVVKDLGTEDAPASPVGDFTRIEVASGRMFFARTTETGGWRSDLWMSDGTEDGTILAATFSHADGYVVPPMGFARVGKRLLFGAHDDAQTTDPGGELWAIPAPVDVVVGDTHTLGRSCPESADFPLSLTAPSDEPVAVLFETEDGSARAGRDYERTSGTLVFAPGVTSDVVRVPVCVQGQLRSRGRTFHLTIRNPANAGLERSRATAQIGPSRPSPASSPRATPPAW